MASIQKVKAGRYTYSRIVESRRVNGKPRPVPLLHLGTADQLLHRLLTHAPPQCTLRSYQHGDIAALKAMADRCRRILWGAERTVVLFISAQLRQGQIRRLPQHLTQRLEALQHWQPQGLASAS